MDSNQERAIQLITTAAELMGWQIAISGGPNIDEEEDVKYMIIGMPEELDKITDILEDTEELKDEPIFH